MSKTIIEQIENLQKQLDDLKELAKEKAEQPFPNEGDEYFSINTVGIIDDAIWYNDNADQYRLDTGNVFKTLDEAEHARTNMETLGRLKNLAKASWKDKHISFDDCWYEILYSFNDISAIWVSTGPLYLGVVKFSDEASAKHAIDLVGKEAIIALFKDSE